MCAQQLCHQARQSRQVAAENAKCKPMYPIACPCTSLAVTVAACTQPPGLQHVSAPDSEGPVLTGDYDLSVLANFFEQHLRASTLGGLTPSYDHILFITKNAQARTHIHSEWG